MILCFYRFGTDLVPIVLDEVDCSTSGYLAILQCSYSSFIGSNCVNGVNDVSVTCCESKVSFLMFARIGAFLNAI